MGEVWSVGVGGIGYLYIYHEGCLSIGNALGLCNSWHHETFYGTSLSPDEVARVRVDLGKTSPKL